jgi:hypothetical protein
MLIIDGVSEEELPLHQEEIIMGALSPELVDLWLAKAFNARHVDAWSAKEASHA